MGFVKTLQSKGVAFASQAMTRLLEDEQRAAKLGELLGKLQQGRKAIDGAQEAALKQLGVASSGDVRAAGKRLAALRKSARKLDEKLSALNGKVSGHA